MACRMKISGVSLNACWLFWAYRELVSERLIEHAAWGIDKGMGVDIGVARRAKAHKTYELLVAIEERLEKILKEDCGKYVLVEGEERITDEGIKKTIELMRKAEEDCK